MRSRILRFLAPIALVLGVSLAGFASAGTAYAAGGEHFYQMSFNIAAWNDGPNVAANNINNTYDDFTPVQVGSYWTLVYTGGGPYNGYCIGAFGNAQGVTTAELDTCSAGGTGSGNPWGSLMTPIWSGGLVAFKVNEFGAYLATNNNSQGALFVLNHGAVYYHEAAA